MTDARLGAVAARLNENLSCLELAQSGLGQIRSLGEELLRECEEMDLELKAAQAEDLIEQVKMIQEGLDQVRTRAAEIITQVEATGGGPGPHGGGASAAPAGPAPKALTSPSRDPDPSARPRGRAAKIESEDDAATRRGRQRENEGARDLAELGYDVEQTPEVPGRKVPDYRIEGEVFDAYAPETNKIRNIWGTIEGKVQSEQASRFVIYLDDSSVSIEDLREQFRRWPINGLDEVLAMRDRTVVRLFP